MTPKAFAVLTYLVEHAGRLVTHDELLAAVWPGIVVEPQAVKKHILAVRGALGDRPKNPAFVETMTKRGYRFIAPVSNSSAASPVEGGARAQGALVGRAVALEELRERWRIASNGERQIVFITGEPGIGKTALAEEFLHQLAAAGRPIRIARGQCIEGFGSKEAYGPMLDALGRLSRGTQARAIVQILLTEAPTWLAQLPGLLTREHHEMLQREILGANRERMLREIAEALGSITSQTPLLLILEDLQWVDDSTVDLISALARRRTPARLMLLATCRTLDAEPASHPLKALVLDLLVHRLCREIALTPLSEADVEAYLAAQSPGSTPPQGLSALVHRHSEGNPLFVVAALEHMAKRNLLANANGRWQLQVPLEQIELEVPDDLRHMIEAQLERLSAPEQSALGLASIAGASFSASVIGPAADIDSRALEDLYEELSRRHHIVRWIGTQPLPDGSRTERYEFVHALYRQVLCDQQLPGRRARLHRQIGERLEAMYAQQIEEVVPELTYHFEQASDSPKAIRYLAVAADIAERRHARVQADSMLARALELITHLPEAERAHIEPQLLVAQASYRAAALDVRAVETLETLAARAADYGLIDIQVRALLDLSYFFSFTSTQRCLEAAQRALQLSARQDLAARTRTRRACAFRRILARGWNAPDALEFREGLAQLGDCQTSSATLPSEVIENAMMHFHSGRYRVGRRLALESRAKLLQSVAERREHPVNPSEWIWYSMLGAANLVLLGEWGAALKELEALLVWTQKNGNDYIALWLRVHLAFLHLHALDFRGVLRICEPALALLRDPVHRAAGGSPIGFPRMLRNMLICSGSASGALGDYARAVEDFSAASSAMDQQMLLYQYWQMPLMAGLTELWLANGDRARAQLEAERFLEMSGATEERTFQGLAWEVNARIALANRDSCRARECIGKAVSTVQEFEVPLAAWRVHATAAHIAEESGNLQSARWHGDLSRVTILQLANSLPEREPLREIFLSAPTVARILKRDSYLQPALAFGKSN